MFQYILGSLDGSLIINSQEGDVDVNISRNQNTTINACHGLFVCYASPIDIKKVDKQRTQCM